MSLKNWFLFAVSVAGLVALYIWLGWKEHVEKRALRRKAIGTWERLSEIGDEFGQISGRWSRPRYLPSPDEVAHTRRLAEEFIEKADRVYAILPSKRKDMMAFRRAAIAFLQSTDGMETLARVHEQWSEKEK